MSHAAFSRKIVSSLVAGSCLALIAVVAIAQTRQPISRDAIEWRSDLKSAHEEALRTNKPILLVFDSESCAFCRKMHETTFSEPGLIWSVNRSYVAIKLEVKQHMEVALKLDIDRTPATIALSPNADLLGGTIGYIDADKFRELIYEAKKLNDRISQP